MTTFKNNYTGLNALQLEGNLETINSNQVRAYLSDEDGYILLASGSTLPSDGDTDYAKGCIFIKTDVSSPNQSLYDNRGDESSANFDTLNETVSVKKELDFNAGSIKVPATKSASWVSKGIVGAWEFSDGTDDTMVTAINLPKDMDLSVAPTIRLCWSSNTTSGDVVWQLEYLFRQADEDTTAAAEETLSQTATSSATADGFTCTDFTGIDVPNANDKTIFVRVKRLGADASDTIGDTAELHSLIFSYTSDKLGKAL